ncbi:hypothetical protein SeLEV6574_g04231 [Synchytrium endobioticum]|uniref:Cyclopropane-fatty-acyl-phospholipid synthase n=1 Tax=Synchytrium endobioticum TaxID=286115 RepID=A0A507D077_9FUNG|nr:hypothetical protein SeLEV6574_g04231 [Synchytrium endobioticum]
MRCPYHGHPPYTLRPDPVSNGRCTLVSGNFNADRFSASGPPPPGGPRGPEKEKKRKEKTNIYIANSANKIRERHTMDLTTLATPLIDNGLLPDAVLRRGTRHLLSSRVAALEAQSLEESDASKMSFIASLKTQPIATHPSEANAQHYELPTSFFASCLGPHMKYSCCLWTPAAATLADAEDAMLSLYAERARVSAGMRILDLGCGWGSVALYLASKYPSCTVTGLSNSKSQREHIMAQAHVRGLSNIDILTADISHVTFEQKFDRIISIEMFEHLKNYEALLAKLATWLEPDGRLFVHVFTHKNTPYHFETADTNAWMATHFFSGGTMPSADLFLFFQSHLEIVERWSVNGVNYAKTCEAWLKNQDGNKAEILRVFKGVYGADAFAWFQRWRLFYIACAEVFAYNGGKEWFVSHYLFKPKAAS